MADTHNNSAEEGRFSTYEEASDEFLHQREAQLRNRLRHPKSTIGQTLLHGVLGHVMLTTVAVAWSAWNGIELSIKNWRWLNKDLRWKKHLYVADTQAYAKGITSISED